jgi:hypothetical protein
VLLNENGAIASHVTTPEEYADWMRSIFQQRRKIDDCEQSSILLVYVVPPIVLVGEEAVGVIVAAIAN